MFNTARPPTDSLAVRRAIIHAIDKMDIIDNVLAGLEEPAYTLFPSNMPYCDVNLSPLLAYDGDKSTLLLDRAGWELEKGRRTKGTNGTLVCFPVLFVIGQLPGREGGVSCVS
jgi:nickel transport system substrate-binding protein